MKKLVDLLAVLDEKEIRGEIEQEISGLTVDSRTVQPGFIFGAIRGFKEDGLSYVDEAIAKGAGVIVSEKLIEKEVTSIKVLDARRAMAKLANAFYQDPSRKLKLVGITGTDGKTTTSYLARAIFNRAGYPAGVIGTIAYQLPPSTAEGKGEEILSATTTTPDACQLQEILSKLVASAIPVAVMEVSSHALVLHRVAGCQFHTIVFTNLAQDHLDFHKTPEAYFRAKEKLFKEFSAECAVINIDDPWGKELIKIPQKRLITYGIESLPGGTDLVAADIKLSLGGTSFKVKSEQGEQEIKLKIIGLHNVYNALAAIGIGLGQGIDLATIGEGLGEVKNIPGRGELIEEGQDFTVIVDYAHTPNALERFLTTLASLGPKRIITVFGCGGDRDRGKRPQMGEIATALSEHAFITNDNPRNESPEAIALDIEVGIRRAGRRNYTVILDRREAIKEALSMAREGDVVVIAGKGHETAQIFGEERIPFDDRKVVKEILRSM